jgi:hypothetical protein
MPVKLGCWLDNFRDNFKVEYDMLLWMMLKEPVYIC